MTVKRFVRKSLKILGIFVGVLSVLLIGFHFWFVHHAEEVIQDLVYARSNGKLRLEVRNFKFNWLSKNMELQDAVFYSTDSVNSSNTYRFAVKRINLKVKAILPMVFDKRVLIDKLELKEPDIVVTRLRANPKDHRDEKEDVSIPQEMGRIYNSIQDAIEVLKVKKFQIEDAKLTLINKVKPDDQPIHISHIDFNVDNLQVDTSLAGKEKILFSDNIVLKSRNQDILFPDGRHRLSFARFRINIEKRLVEFDSCTIAAIKTENSPTGFSIFFDALKMTDIDFDTLYRAEVIKADSVYCINPRFNLEVEIGEKTGPRKTPPKLDQIIRQLTGDLQLNFVVVNNASFDINTVRNNKPSSFKSEGNNFEIQGLSIDNDAKRPFRVEKFAMAIRNYENFLRDSQYVLQFDSILVNNDHIYLNNFGFEQRLNGKTIQQFKVPQFQLTGLSWDDLLFEQKLRARQALLYKPSIIYNESGRTKKTAQTRRRFYDMLADINEVIQLDDLSIINGDIDLDLAGDVSMQLKNATVDIKSRTLLESDKLAGLRRSVDHLDFTKGSFRIRDVNVDLDGIRYSGTTGKLQAAKAHVRNRNGKLNMLADGVSIDEVFINEKTGDVTVAGVQWKKADIHFESAARGQAKLNSFISLTGLAGSNTTLDATIGDYKMKGFFDQVNAAVFLSRQGELPIINGLAMKGRDFDAHSASTRLNVASFSLYDKVIASLSGTVFSTIQNGDSTIMNVPELSFIPDIQAFIGGVLDGGDMKITRPVINIHRSGLVAREATNAGLPKFQFSKIAVEQPIVHVMAKQDTGFFQLHWYGDKGNTNSIVLVDLAGEGNTIAARQVYLSVRDFMVENSRHRKFNAGNGELSVLLNDLRLEEKDAVQSWQGRIAMLEGKDFQIDSIGKKSGQLYIRNLQLKDFAINSGSILNVRKMIQQNTGFRIQEATGAFRNSETALTWDNLVYDKSTKRLTLDSFSFEPVDDLPTFVSKHPYQADYIQLKTGAINIGPFDINRYLQDSIIAIGSLKADSLVFADFRDNRPPFLAGKIKPLMVTRLKEIPFKLSIDSLLFTNGRIEYTELNPKTNQSGTIRFSNLQMGSFPVRNFDFKNDDSLSIEADGLLMDSVMVRLKLRESYTDSLNGFLLTVQMAGSDLRILNPVLEPLASAKLRSGVLDTMTMNVYGNDQLAYGTMNMKYDQLKIRIVPADAKKKRFWSGIVNFAANTIIRNKNRKRDGTVFYVRDRDRSSLNFLIKMVMSGVTSSVGVKSTKKALRKYKKELRQRKLPPLNKAN